MDTTFRAVSGDRFAAEKLFSNEFTGTVDTVFEHTVNITDISGDMYALVLNTSGNAPATIRLAAEAGFSFQNLNIHAGDTVFTNNQTLCIENKLIVVAGGITLWQCQLPLFPDALLLKASLPLLRELIGKEGAEGGLKAYINGIDGQTGLLPAELARRAAMLKHQFIEGDLNAMTEAGQRLLGLGQGSTPSGDDFLTGLILIIAMPGAPFHDIHKSFAKAMADLAGAATTKISAAMLTHAARGEVQETAAGLLDSIHATGKTGLTHYARQVIALGGSSGTDLLTGIITGLELGLHLMSQAKER